MARPAERAATRSFTDSVVLLRRALYELQRKPTTPKAGATEPNLLNFMSEQQWPSLVNDFDQAMQRLLALGKAECGNPEALPGERRFRLTHDGLVEEETVGQPGRRGLPRRVLAELGRPDRLAGLIVTSGVGIIGYLLGRFFH